MALVEWLRSHSVTASILFGEKCLPIRFVVKLTACLAFAGASSLISTAQQAATPLNSDFSEQTQTQVSTQQPASPPSSSQPSSPSQGSSQTPAQPASSQQPSSPQSDKNKNDQSSGKVEGTSNDRLFYTLPNFLSMQKGGKLPPLTAKDKFKVVALSTFDYVQYPWWGLLAAVSQAENSEPAYGQGWGAYAKRFGTTAGDSMVENFMVGAVFPSILHQDPRFYYSEQGGFAHRAGYAVSRIFVTRSDSGKAQFNYSEIFGAATAAAISTYTYHPRSTYLSTPTNPHLFVASDRTLSNTISVWGTQVGLDTVTIVIKEFWPDVHRKMSHKKPEATAPEPPSR